LARRFSPRLHERDLTLTVCRPHQPAWPIILVRPSCLKDRRAGRPRRAAARVKFAASLTRLFFPLFVPTAWLSCRHQETRRGGRTSRCRDDDGCPLDREVDVVMLECPFAGHPPNNQDVTTSLPLRDLLLPTTGQPSAYADVFVDNVVALAQGRSGGHCVR
jgi:hypothetical protein